MNNLEVLQLHISKPFEPLYPAAVLEWASKEARKDNESRPTSGLGFFKDKIAWWSDRLASRLDLSNQFVGHLFFYFPILIVKLKWPIIFISIGPVIIFKVSTIHRLVLYSLTY